MERAELLSYNFIVILHVNGHGTSWLTLWALLYDPFGGDWKCGSGKIGTVENAGWKRREWKHRHDFAGVENAGSILMQNVMLGSVEKRMVRLISREIIFEEFQRISSQSTNVTNRRTDRRTSYHGDTALSTHQMGVLSSKIAIFASCGRYICRSVIRDQNYYVSVCIVPKWLFVDIEQMTKWPWRTILH